MSQLPTPRRQSAAPMPPCPEESTLRKLVSVELSGPDTAALEQHIDSCPACQQVLQRLVGSLPLPLQAGARGSRDVAAESTGGTVEQPPLSASAAQRALAKLKAPPVQIPGYELLTEVGRGCMGVVYQAR